MFYKITYNLRLTALTLAAVLSIQSIALAAPDVVSAGVPARDGRSALAHYGIPASVAVAGDSFAGSEAGDGSPTFILIEDAHTNPSGQINLSATLDRVIRKHGLTAVLTEGTDRDVSLSELRRYGTARARAAAAMPFVRKGELKGSEFLQLTRDQDFAIVGVEDRGLYDRAVERYAQAAAARRKTSTALERVEAAAHAVAEKLLNPRLARFRAEREKYASDGVSSADHWASLAVLAQELGIRQADLSQLDRLDRVRKLEKSLDLERVSVEWAQAVAGLPEAEREALSVIEAAAARRNNLESVSAAGARLRKALGDQPVRGALGRYLRYLKAIDGLDPHQLLKQAELLERLVAERLAVTAEEARFVRLDRAIGHLKELADLTLTPSGHAYLEELGEDARLDRVTGFLNRQIMELGIAPERAVLVEQARDAELDAARDFYRIALERDRVIVDRALAVARERGLGTAALITGGFHTQNLTALLRERGIAYQVITPQVYEETDRARYERLLLAHAPERPFASTDTASALITPYTADTPGAVQALTSSFRSLPAEGSAVSEAASGPRTQDQGARMAASSAETPASIVLSSDLVWEAIRAKHGSAFNIRFKPEQKEGEGWPVPLDSKHSFHTRSMWTLVYKFAGPALYTTILAILTAFYYRSPDLPKMQLATIIAFYWQKYIQTKELTEFTRSTVRALGGDDVFREIVRETISQTIEAADQDPDTEWSNEVERQGLRRVRQRLLFERIEPKAFEFVWGFHMKIYFEEPRLERALAHSFDPRTRYIHKLDGWTSLKQKRQERKREAAEGSGSFERPIPARGRSDTAAVSAARLPEVSDDELRAELQPILNWITVDESGADGPTARALFGSDSLRVARETAVDQNKWPTPMWVFAGLGTGSRTLDWLRRHNDLNDPDFEARVFDRVERNLDALAERYDRDVSEDRRDFWRYLEERYGLVRGFDASKPKRFGIAKLAKTASDPGRQAEHAFDPEGGITVEEWIVRKLMDRASRNHVTIAEAFIYEAIFQEEGVDLSEVRFRARSATTNEQIYELGELIRTRPSGWSVRNLEMIHHPLTILRGIRSLRGIWELEDPEMAVLVQTVYGRPGFKFDTASMGRDQLLYLAGQALAEMDRLRTHADPEKGIPDWVRAVPIDPAVRAHEILLRNLVARAGTPAGARLSEASGTRRLWTVPIPRSIPFARRLVAREVYGRLAGMGASMGLDEPYFKRVISEIFTSCDLRLTYNLTRYQVTERDEESRTVRERQKVKKFLRLVGWQERWYDVWSRESASAPDAAAALRRMSMAEFLGDIGSDESLDRPGVTETMFEQGRTAAYRNLPGMSDRRLPAVESLEIPMLGGDPIPARLVRPREALTRPVPVVVIYHGFGMSGSNSYFDELEEKLIAQGIAVLRPDLLSHGRSRRPLGDATEMVRYNNAISAYLRTNRHHLDAGRVGIYGFSFGAYLALRAALESELGNGLGSLVLMNPPTAETFTRHRIYEWHAPLLNELLPAEDFQHLVDKMQGLEWPLLHLIRTLKAGELASIGRKIMLFMSEQDETIDFKDQEMIRRFAGALGVRPVLLKRQGHFPVGAPYRSAIDQAAAHLGRTLNNSGARMADERPQDLDWFRERILDAVRKNGYARILAVCTANFHRSAAMEWFIGSDAIRRGWNRLAVGSAGTAWWQDEPTLFGSMWGVIPTSVRSSAAETPGAVEGIRTYLRRTAAAEGAGVPGSADLTDREAADLYLRFDPEHWSMPGDIPDDYDPSDWKMMGHVLEQIVWDAEEDLLSSTRLRNGDFKDLTRDVAAQTYPDQSSRENLLTAQEQYGHPKPLTRTALDEADVILIAGEGHRTIIAAASPEALAKTVKLSQLIPTAFNAWIDQGDIPDPGRNEIEEAHLVRALLPASRILLDALAPDGPALSGDDSVQKIRKVRQDLRHVRNLFFKGVHPSDRAIYAQSPTPAGGLDESRLSPVDRFQRMQKRLTENFERVAYHEFEIGRLIDASEVLLRELSERGGSAVRQKDVQFLVRRVIWLRLLLARRMIEKGQFLKARFIWWQVLNARQSGGDAFPDPVYHRVESRVLAFESYRAARTALLRGDLDRADLEVLKMAEWAPDDDPLLGFIRQYREKVRAASAGGPSEPARVPSEDADPKPFETGHAMAVHDSLTDPGLIYKRSLLEQTDLEVEAMQMALIASRAGFEVRSVGGYWMIEVEGFVPFGMDDGWMVQPRVAPLPSFEDTPEADRDAVLNRVLELDRAFRDRGITHYDLKPNNLARGEDGSLTVLDYGFVFDDPSGARMAVGPAAAVRDTDPDLRVSGPMISLNIRDLGAVSVPLPADAPADAKPFVGVDMMKGLRTARSWLPEFRRQGIGRVYLVGLAASGEMSGLIQSDWREPKNRRPDSLGTPGPLFYYGNPANNGVAVQVSAWLKNRKTVDGHQFDNLLGQNVFSVMDPRLIHEGSVPPAATRTESQRILEEELRELLREAREFGLDVYGDWIPWRAPESVTLTNYKRFFWREPSPEEAADYARAVAEEKKLFPSGHGKRYENTRSRKKLTPTERWIADLLKKAGPFVPVRLPLPDGGEKLVFVRRANIGIDSEDQLVLNPLHPDNIREFIEGLTWLAELGFAGARTDLGFRLLPDFIRPYYEEMREHLSKRGQTLEGWMRESGIRTLREGESFEDWWERQKNTVQPLREIISVVRHRAREMDFVIEAYPYQSHEQKELLALGVDHNYDDSLFKGMLHALRTHSEALPNALRGALARAPHGTVYASNFDEDSLDRLLKKMGRQSAVTGIRLLLATLPRMGVPVLYTERDYLGLEGSAVPMPGGSDPDADSHHPFPAEGEFADRLKPDWAARKIQNAPLPTMLRELEAALGPRTLPSEVWIPGNTNAKNRLVPLFWRDAAGDWYLAIADLYPEWGANTGFGPGRIKIELTASEVPAGLDPSLFTGPLAVHTPQAAWSQSPFWRIGTGDWLSKGSARTLDIDIDHEHYQSFNMVLKLGPGRTTARPETGRPVSIWEPGREPRARERALLKLLAAAPAGDPDAVNALQIALSYPDDNLRAQAANILARRSLVSRSPHIDPADYAGLMMDPFAPYRVAGVQIPQAYLRTYPEPVARQWLVRNGRYSLMHALRHLSLLARGVGEEQVPGDAVYAAGALERFRERLASDAASWESARDAELALEVERAIEETRSVRPSVEWDRDLSAGSPVPANTAELLRLMVLRSQAIARRYPKEYRDTFYWVLEAVREIVPDVKGDPTAEVVWRGRRNAGARMADPTASAAREFLGHFGRTDDGGLILPSGVDRYLAVDVLIKLLHGGDVSYDLAETNSDGSTLWRTYRHDGLTGLERVTDGTAELRNEVRGAIEALGMDPDRLRRLVEDPEFKNPFLETFDDRIRAAAAADAAASGLEAPDPEAEERFRRVDTIFQPAIRSRVRGTERDIFFVRVVHNRDRAVETKGPGKGGIRFVFSNFLNNDAEFMGRFERLAGEGFGLEELRFFLRKWLREEALALSVGMTIKAAVADLPYGGAKGVLLRADVHPDPSGGFTVLDDIPTDPAAGPLKRSLALGERDQVLRSAARSLWEAGRVGPRIDVPAPDVGSTPFNMNILTDELIRARFLKDRRSGALAEYPEGLAELLDRIEPTGGPVYSPTLNRYLAAVVEWRASNPSVPVDPDSIAVLPASFTAKTVQMGGSVFRTESTGYGAQLITREIVRRLKGNAMTAGERPTAKIEGLGNVGYHLADSAVRFDAYRVQWIAEMRGVFYKEAGFTSEDLVRLRAFLSDPEARPQDLASGSSPYFIEGVRTFPQNRGVMESFWSAPADVLYLAAKESSLTAENISSVRGTVIVEAANGAVTSAAARALAGDPDRVHVPDVLANAGGVTVSYLEWLQNLSGERWNEDRVRRELDGILLEAARKVFALRSELELNSGKPVDLATAADVLAYRAVREAAERNDSAKGARMADGADAGEGPALAYRRTRLEAENGLHMRPSTSIFTTFEVARSDAKLYGQKLWMRIHRVREDGTIDRSRSANIDSILELLALGITDGTELHLEAGGTVQPEQAEALVGIFADLLSDRRTLSHGINHRQEEGKEYWARIHHVFDPGLNPLPERLSQNLHLRYSRIETFLEAVALANRGLDRAHVAVERDDRTVAVFRIWREGGNVWYALKGQAGRIRIEPVGPELPPDLPAYMPVVDEEVDAYTGALQPHQAVALELALADELVGSVGNFIGADPGRSTLQANVELDAQDLVRRSGYDLGDLLPRLRAVQERVREQGLGRLILADGDERLPGARTVRLAHEKNAAYRATAGPDTTVWSYLQEDSQILPILSSTILSALLAAAPEEGKEAYLLALTPLYQKLTGSEETLTPALLDEARSDPARLTPIKPLTLRGYLDVAVYLQELARGATAKSA